MGTQRKTWFDAIERNRTNFSEPGDDQYWAPSLDTASRDELHSIQSDKLSYAVEYMAAYSPMYAQKLVDAGISPHDIRSVDDLHLLPVVTKLDMSATIRDDEPWGEFTAVNDDRWLTNGWQVFSTSGTTAAPRSFRYTQYDRELWSWANARALYAMGIRRGRDVGMMLFGYGPHVAMWGMHHGMLLMGIPQLAAGGLDTRTRVVAIDQQEPTVLACTPSYALHLSAVMQEMGIEPADTKVRILVLAGEPVPDASKQRIERTWNATVHQFYGCTEVAPSCGGYTCEAGDMHFLEDTHLIETVDPETYEPVKEGQRGISVVTNLMSEASPQIRFEVGDYTTLSYKSCLCGRSHVICEGGFAGRADDMLNIRGVTLFPSSVESVVRGVPGLGEEFKIVLSRRGELDEITVVVERQDSTLSKEELAETVASAFRARLELRASVEILDYGTLPTTMFKAKRVEDRR